MARIISPLPLITFIGNRLAFPVKRRRNGGLNIKRRIGVVSLLVELEEYLEEDRRMDGVRKSFLKDKLINHMLLDDDVEMYPHTSHPSDYMQIKINGKSAYEVSVQGPVSSYIVDGMGDILEIVDQAQHYRYWHEYTWRRFRPEME